MASRNLTYANINSRLVKVLCSYRLAETELGESMFPVSSATRALIRATRDSIATSWSEGSLT